MLQANLRVKEKEDVLCTNKVPRLYVNILVIWLLKALIAKKSFNYQKRLIFAVACLGLNGSFEIHELVSKKRKSSNPTTAILRSDLRKVDIKGKGNLERLLMVWLCCPKKDKMMQGVLVKLINASTFSCPFKALDNWRVLHGQLHLLIGHCSEPRMDVALANTLT